MTEAERRAAVDAAVMEVFERIVNAYLSTPGMAGIKLPESQRKVIAAVANLRALHETVVDAPGIYATHIPAERMTGDSVVVDPDDVADPPIELMTKL